MIKAIETRYAGELFRSRLEARWAVFFDALKVGWEYEEVGFEADGKRYLPDFILPALGVVVEVKGTSESLLADSERYAPLWTELLDGGAFNLLVLSDFPRQPEHLTLHPMYHVKKDQGLCRSWAGWVPVKGDTGHYPYLCEYNLLTAFHHLPYFKNVEKGSMDKAWEVGCREIQGLEAFPDVAAAYRSGSESRFEHGQSGAR